MRNHLVTVKSEFTVNFSVFSKTKFDETLDDAELLLQTKRRFGSSMPLNHIDIVLVQSLEEPKFEEIQATQEHVTTIEHRESIG